MHPTRAAVVQLSCGRDEDANLARVEELITESALRGATLIATPENTNFLGPHEEKARRAQPLDGPVCARFAALASKLGVYLLLGSFNETSDDPVRCHNTSVLFDPGGTIVATYRKIHLFDIDHPEAGTFTESATVAPGETPVVAEAGGARLGLSICYDLRFPELYRALAAQGAEILTVPSAFTRPTGRDHWEVLLRARAIENQCFVLAPAQWGVHDDEGIRESFGHTMIVDPWGRVLECITEGEGLAIADLEPGAIERVRREIPVGRHRRI